MYRNIIHTLFAATLWALLLNGVQAQSTTIYADANEMLSWPADKCGFDAAMSRQLQQQLGMNWGYGYDSLLADLGGLSQSPYVAIDSLGASVQGRAIWQLTITDPSPPTAPRRTVFVHARTHPNEVQAWWVTDEMIRLLLSEDPLARNLRENTVFYIIPMYNPDGVELGKPRQNANNVDIESGWDDNLLQPEVVVLKNRFTELMASQAPIEVALNMHSSISCTRYFVYHHQNGTSQLFTQLEKQFIGGVRSHFPGSIEPWDYFVSWSSGTPQQYPESWFWMNFQEAVMALTYEDMNCGAAGQYDQTAYAMLHGVSDYLGLVVTAIASAPPYRAEARPLLAQNFPNPVQLSARTTLATMFQYQLFQPQRVRLALYDVLGREVAVLDEGLRSANVHRVYFDAAALPSGMYFYRLVTEQDVYINRLQIIR